MNNLISLPANHGGWFTPGVSFSIPLPCTLLVPPLFYLHSGLVPALWTQRLNQDCGRNITKRRAIHHQGCPGYEIQAGTDQQWVLSCMLDLMLVYLSPKQLHDMWFIEQPRWYNNLTTSLGSWPASISMIMSHIPRFPSTPSQKDEHWVFFGPSLSHCCYTCYVRMFEYVYCRCLLVVWCHQQEKSSRYLKRGRLCEGWSLGLCVGQRFFNWRGQSQCHVSCIYLHVNVTSVVSCSCQSRFHLQRNWVLIWLLAGLQLARLSDHSCVLLWEIKLVITVLSQLIAGGYTAQDGGGNTICL